MMQKAVLFYDIEKQVQERLATEAKYLNLVGKVWCKNGCAVADPAAIALSVDNTFWWIWSLCNDT